MQINQQKVELWIVNTIVSDQLIYISFVCKNC